MHDVQSPRTDDSAIEAEIQRKGLTAPRVTPADIEANIRGEYYINAGRAVEADADLFGREDPPEADADELGLVTLCILITQSGFKVVGTSACVSKTNFDEDIGRKAARENAIQQMWGPMGYALKERLAERSVAPQPPVDNAHVADGAEQFGG